MFSHLQNKQKQSKFHKQRINSNSEVNFEDFAKKICDPKMNSNLNIVSYGSTI